MSYHLQVFNDDTGELLTDVEVPSEDEAAAEVGRMMKLHGRIRMRCETGIGYATVVQRFYPRELGPAP